MNFKYLLSMACLVLMGCYADSGVNPSEKYPKNLQTSFKVSAQNLPACDASLEGKAAAINSFFYEVYVCSENVWIYLRNATPIDTSVQKYQASDMFPKNEIGSVVDSRDGQIYKTVKIKTQVWFAENLRYGFLSRESFCHFNYGTNVEKVGCLYTWNDLFPSYSSKDLCPNGFHVPSREEWLTLFDAVGGIATAGDMLRTPTSYSGDQAVNAYGFSIYPVGYYSENDYGVGSFWLEESFAPFWSSAMYSGDSPNAYAVFFYTSESSATIRNDSKKYGYSARCVRD